MPRTVASLSVLGLSDRTSCAPELSGAEATAGAPGLLVPTPQGHGHTQPGVNGSCGYARVYEKRAFSKAARGCWRPDQRCRWTQHIHLAYRADVGLTTWPRWRLSEMPTEKVPLPLPATLFSSDGSHHEQPTRKQWGVCPTSLRVEYLHQLFGMFCGRSDSSRSCIYISMNSWVSILYFGWKHSATSLTLLLKLFQLWQ